MTCSSHLSEHAFPLHLLLQDTKRLLNVVVADENLHCAAAKKGRRVAAG